MDADRAITFKRRSTLEFDIQSQSSGLTRLVSGGRTCLGPPTRAPDQWTSPLERARIEAPTELPTAFKAERLRLREASPKEVEESGLEPVPQEVLQCYENLQDCRPVHIEPESLQASLQAGMVARRRVCYGIISACTSVAASGTHNVILGLRAFLDRAELSGSRLLGIRHLANGNEFDIETQELKHFLNQGGCDMLPTLLMSRVNARLLDKLVKMAEDLQLEGLLMLCGAGELEHVSKVSNHFAKALPSTPVVAVVHSLSGWARLPGWMPTNLGFDSAASVLAEVTGNVALSRSSLTCDFYHFLNCGSPPLTLEVALQIRPTLCYIGADIALRGLTLQGICDEICDVIVARHHDHGLHSGEILLSDDFLEELAEMRELRRELVRIRQERPAEIRSEEDAKQALEPRLGAFFELLPADVQHDLVYRNCTDGRPLLSTQDVDRELGALVARNLQRRRERGERSVENFAHFPRSTKHLAVSPMPTPLDCALGTALGHTAGALLLNSANGFVASICNVASPPLQWKPCGVPLLRFLRSDPSGGMVLRRHELTNDVVFGLWRRVRDQWRFRLSYRQPGPVQYWGPGGQIHAWMTYTLRASCAGSVTEQFEQEIQEASKPDRIFTVPLPMPCSLVRRREALLSPLQRWRCAYQPQLPEVLQGRFRIAEVDRKGRICADPARLSAAFPNLWRNDHVKHVMVETMPDEVNVLQMLPERGNSNASFTVPRSDSCGAFSGVSGGSSGPEQKPLSPDSGKEETGLAGADVEFSLKQTNLRIGVALVGRAGPGMNNVIQGLHDYLKTVDGKVVCIAMGIAGLAEGHVFELTEELLLPHKNQGGCDLLGQSQPEDLFRLPNNLGPCAATVKKLELDGLVVWGGRNVHSWTVELAEYFVAHQVSTRVIGVPASVESDLPFIEQTLGHDTVCRLFSSIVGNLATQAASSKMQWCFVRIPGRSISHIAAEVALETLPHVVLVAGEMHKEEMGLSEVTQEICNVIEARGREEMNYGVVIIPDQFMTAVREMRQLALELHEVRRACPEAFNGVEQGAARDFGHVSGLLPPLSRALFQSIPERVRAQICMAKVDVRSSEVDLSGVETEVIFKTLVEAELTRRVVVGTYKGPFQCRTYSLPYHGRATMPTNFDCDLGYTIGYAAGILIDGGRTCLLVDITKLKENVRDWEVGAIPLCSLLSFDEPSLEGDKPCRHYISAKGRLTYDVGSESTMPDPCKRTLVNPGPAQYEGPCATVTTQTLCMPQLQRVRQMVLNDQLITDLKAQASAGCPPEILEAVRMLLQGGVDLLRTI